MNQAPGLRHSCMHGRLGGPYAIPLSANQQAYILSMAPPPPLAQLRSTDLSKLVPRSYRKQWSLVGN
jgi:hypothetical protein